MKPPVADEAKFREVALKSMDLVKKSSVTSEGLPNYGTA